MGELFGLFLPWVIVIVALAIIAVALAVKFKKN